MAEIERDHNPHGLDTKEEVPSSYISGDELLIKLKKYIMFVMKKKIKKKFFSVCYK